MPTKEAPHAVSDCFALENVACGFTRNNNTSAPVLTSRAGRDDGKGEYCSITYSSTLSFTMTSAQAKAVTRELDGGPAANSLSTRLRTRRRVPPCLPSGLRPIEHFARAKCDLVRIQIRAPVATHLTHLRERGVRRISLPEYNIPRSENRGVLGVRG
jgi:hypothetical protein